MLRGALGRLGVVGLVWALVLTCSLAAYGSEMMRTESTNSPLVARTLQPVGQDGMQTYRLAVAILDGHGILSIPFSVKVFDGMDREVAQGMDAAKRYEGATVIDLGSLPAGTYKAVVYPLDVGKSEMSGDDMSKNTMEMKGTNHTNEPLASWSFTVPLSNSMSSAKEM